MLPILDFRNRPRGRNLCWTEVRKRCRDRPRRNLPDTANPL